MIRLKYAFINRHKRVWPISVQCRVLQVSVAGYHEHCVRRASAAQRRHLSDDALLVHIKAVCADPILTHPADPIVTRGWMLLGYRCHGSLFSRVGASSKPGAIQ